MQERTSTGFGIHEAVKQPVFFVYIKALCVHLGGTIFLERQFPTMVLVYPCPEDLTDFPAYNKPDLIKLINSPTQSRSGV